MPGKSNVIPVTKRHHRLHLWCLEGNDVGKKRLEKLVLPNQILDLIINPRRWRHIGLKGFEYKNTNNELVSVRCILHTIEMGDATACWIANTLNILFHKAVALSNPRSIFRATNSRSAEDLGLVPGHLPDPVFEPHRFLCKPKNRIPEAHQCDRPFEAFRLGFQQDFDSHGIFMDDSMIACRDASAMVEETRTCAKKANFLHSDIESSENVMEFCGKLYFKSSWEIGLPQEKWNKIKTLQSIFNSQNSATGHQITSLIGLVLHICDIFPEVKNDAVRCAWWSGIFSRIAHSDIPDIVKSKWRAILKQDFLIPEPIVTALNRIIRQKWQKRAKVINLLLSPLDTFQPANLSKAQESSWREALHSQDIHRITKVAADLKIVAFVFSIDSTPAYGPGCVSHSWGPPISDEDIRQGITERRKPGDHFAMDWRSQELFQRTFRKNSSGFELVGKSLCLNHWWFKQAARISPRAAHLGAKIVLLIFGDNTGAVSIFQREKTRTHVLGPCHSLDTHRKTLNAKIFCAHLAGKRIPADHPSRMDQKGWKNKLHKSLEDLGLDLSRQGRRVAPPPNWKSDLEEIMKFHTAYRNISNSRSSTFSIIRPSPTSHYYHPNKATQPQWKEGQLARAHPLGHHHSITSGPLSSLNQRMIQRISARNPQNDQSIKSKSPQAGGPKAGIHSTGKTKKNTPPLPTA